MSNQIIHFSEMKDFPDAVYVGRAMRFQGIAGSPFGNPYRLETDGDRKTVLQRYRDYVLASPELMAKLPELAGKPLACWCRRSTEARTARNACHADVLADLLEIRFYRNQIDELEADRANVTERMRVAREKGHGEFDDAVAFPRMALESIENDLIATYDFLDEVESRWRQERI